MQGIPYSPPLLEAAYAAIEAADLEYEVDDLGSHHLVRVTVGIDPWLRLAAAVIDARKEQEREILEGSSGPPTPKGVGRTDGYGGHLMEGGF
jgi:hypothetical protein